MLSEEPRMSTPFPLAEMQPHDFDAVLALWRQSEGVGLTPSDNREAVHSFLVRNPGLSFVAWHEGRIIGAVLCGHDGRRGYLYHLAVAPVYRKQGLARAIVDACLSRLGACGILKATIFVYGHNDIGSRFWRKVGWRDRTDLVVLQRDTPS